MKDVKLETVFNIYQDLQIIKLTRELLGLSNDNIFFNNILSDCIIEELRDDEFEVIINEYFESKNNFYNQYKNFNPMENITIRFPSILNEKGLEYMGKYVEYVVYFICSIISHEKDIKYKSKSPERIKMIDNVYTIIFTYQEEYQNKENFLKKCTELKFDKDYVEIFTNMFFNK